MTLTEQGLKNGLRDLGEIRRILASRRREAEASLASAECDLGEYRKLDSFAAIQQDEYAARLAAMTGELPDTRPGL